MDDNRATEWKAHSFEVSNLGFVVSVGLRVGPIC